MQVYKLRAGKHPIRLIDVTTFEYDTGKEKPWYQRPAQGSKGDPGSQFAICPGCDNPIQLIGLYRRSAKTPHPYGRHTSRAVPGFNHFDPSVFSWCPYVKPRKHGKSDRRAKLDGVALSILETIATRFHHIITMIENDAGIGISDKLARGMLETYLGERGYLYTGATLRNVPWMVAYFSNAQSLWGRSVGNNPALVTAIREHIPAAVIDPEGRLQKGSEFYDVRFCFRDHQQTLEDGALVETTVFDVRDHRGRITYTQVVRFAPEAFEALEGNAISHRDERLLRVAADCLKAHLGSYSASLAVPVTEG